jgi:hypothetical protein
MRRKFLLGMLTVVIAMGVSNCTTDSAEAQQQETLQQRVASAKLQPGTIANNQLEPGLIYVDIPTKGYLALKMENNNEQEQIMDLVYLRFKEEFDGNRGQSLEDKNLDSRAKNIACGDWTPIGPDPNDRVYRYCCNLNTGVCVRKTCDCGYCCD